MERVGLESIHPSLVGSENVVALVGEKRVAENDGGDDLVVNKKARDDSGGHMKRVAGIVLVLAAMGKMRGSRSPSAAEKELMAEARENLAGMCEGMAPEDIVPRHAIKVLIEDLGLNRPKDQRLGFRPPRISIAEKLQLTKRKIEESKKFTVQSAMHSPQLLQTGFGARAEIHGTLLHAAQRFPPNKSSPTSVSAGGCEAAVEASAQASTSSSNQFPINEVKSAMISRGSLLSPLERDSSSLELPRMEAVHFRLDGIPNGSAYASQVQANSSGDLLLEKSSTCSPQLQSGAVPQLGQANKVPDYAPSKGAPQLSQSMNSVQASSFYTNHNDISKNVHMFLQPRLPEHPSWTPPSTDYMHKSVSCQICKVSINDVESLLVCDACEKGVHLKCLQSYNQKGIPKSEWHCPKCLISSKGKPLPPKYGRVTRNITAPKASLNTCGVQASSEVENSDQKVNCQKIVANANPGSLHHAHVSRTGSNCIKSASDSKTSNASIVEAANFSSSRVKLLSDIPNSSSKRHFQNSESFPCDPEESISQPKSLPNFESGLCSSEKSSDASINTCHSSQAPINLKDIDKTPLLNCTKGSANHYHDVKTFSMEETCECKPGCDVRTDVAQAISAGTSDVSNGAIECFRPALDVSDSVNWVGDALQLVDEKTFYNSCRINGIVYKLQDHTLFGSNNGNLKPSKLQALWEDTKTGSKWAVVNRCYFPVDLPDVVGQPCTPEDNEVYESNHGSTVRAGLIQGPCEVLPPNKFNEENERRIHLGHEANDGLRPIFLCKWFYDESKGLFRPITD